MRKLLILASVLAAFATPAAAQELKTTPGALLCASPFQLTEASKARGDQKWLQSLNCVIARSGIHGILIEANSLGFKVRLKPLTSDDLTMWGDSFQFETLDGGTFTHWGTPVPKYNPASPVTPPPASGYASVRTVTVPSTDPVQSDSFFKSLQQTITGAGYECDRVASYASTGAERTVTCKIAGANAFFRIAMRDGATSVQRIEWRR